MSVLVRHLVKGEELPEKLRTGFESAPNADFDWIWVSEHEGKITAILVMSPAHVAALIIRLISIEGAHQNDVRALLHTAAKEIKAKGYVGYFTWVDPTQELENRLMNAIKSTGGYQFTAPQVLCAGTF